MRFLDGQLKLMRPVRSSHRMPFKIHAESCYQLESNLKPFLSTSNEGVTQCCALARIEVRAISDIDISMS